MSATTTFNPNEFYISYGVCHEIYIHHDCDHGLYGKFIKLLSLIFGTRVYGEKMYTMISALTPYYQVDVADPVLNTQISNWAHTHFLTMRKIDIQIKPSSRHIDKLTNHDL